MSRANERFERWAPRAAWALVVLYVVATGLALWMDIQVYVAHVPSRFGVYDAIFERGLFLGPFTLFAVVGAVIVSRRPRNAVGWIMLAAASVLSLSGLGVTYALLSIGISQVDPPVLGLVAKWFELPGITLALVLTLVFIPLLFPDGRLPSPRWRIVAWAAGVGVALVAVESVFAPRLAESVHPGLSGEPIQIYDIANPLAVGWMEPITTTISTARSMVLTGLAVFAAIAVVVRFRRSEGIERQQMKWFVYAVGLVTVTLSAILVWTALPRVEPPTWMWLVLVAGGFIGYPVAIGLAVVRYRLYEIDRIISRTVSYGLVIAVLAGVYVAGVVGLGAAVTALTGQGDSDLVVAVSTLAAAGLFRPVRARVQTAVDRRFNRTGYEARRAVEAFTRDVRDEVDLDRIRGQLAETAAVATQPTHASVWLADEEPGA